MAKFQIEIKECLRIKKEFIAMIEEMKDYEKRLYAVKGNLEKMSEYTGIVKRLERECQAVTEERGDVERLFQTFCDCVQCYETAEKNVKEQKLDWHFILDMAGLIPGAGALFDGVNTAWYAAEGDVENALLSGLAFLPAIGEGIGAGKTSLKIGGKVMEHLDDAADVAKAADKAGDAAKAADKAKDAAKAADRAEDAAETAGKAKKGEESAGEIGKYVDEAIEGGNKTVKEIISESAAAKKWGISDNGTNQGVKHFSDYWEQYPERIPSLEQRLGVQEGSFNNSLEGFNNFTEQAERVISEATSTGNVRTNNGKTIYYIEGAVNTKKGVVVIVRDGKIQSMMPSDLKSFNKMQ